MIAENNSPCMWPKMLPLGMALTPMVPLITLDQGIITSTFHICQIWLLKVHGSTYFTGSGFIKLF